MVEIVWTHEAKKWLKEIHDYIADDNLQIAKRVVNEIIQKAEILKSFPRIGQRLFLWPKKEIRMILYGHYKIVYLNKSKDSVHILGVYHGALDLKKHFKI